MENEAIIGVDEVGRGCIAGDLVICAYALQPGLCREKIERLRTVAMDSKAFSSRAKRERSAQMVQAFGISVMARRTPAQIEAANIRVATLDAMQEAALLLYGKLRALGAKAPLILVDGKDLPAGLPATAQARIKGDASVLEISCASVLAKTCRDREMDELALTWPGYGFEKHAGYGTRQHIEAIGRLGLCPIHRSWAEKFDVRRYR